MKKWVLIFAVTAGLSIACYSYTYRAIEMEKSGDSLNTNVQTAIVLGAKIKEDASPAPALRARLDRVLTLYEEGHVQQIIVTGGQGHDEPTTESSAMQQYLMMHGVDSEDILLESRSTSTYENLVNASYVTEERHVYIVSSDFHLKRARYLAEKVGFTPVMIAAPTPPSVAQKAHVRETLALLKTWLFRK